MPIIRCKFEYGILFVLVDQTALYEITHPNIICNNFIFC